MSLAFSGCSDLFNGSSSSIQFKIDIPHTREISSTHYKMTVELISMDGKFSSNQESTVYPNTSETFKFDDILIGSNIKIKAKITAEEKEIYTGETDWQEVKTGTNKISLTLEKVYQAPEAQEPEEKPPVEIKNAAKPIIVVQPISQTELVDPNSNSAPSFSTTISIGAIVSDEGTLSFQWQEKTGSNWEPLEGLDVKIDVSDIGVNTSTLPITLDLNTSRVFRCIVTNTNENINGEKTAEIISNEVTVAYIEGTLSSISATYKSDSYELLGKDFNYKNVTIEETYTSSDNATTTITVIADDSRYTISPNPDSENAIGYVPYTVTYNDSTLPSSLTASLTVPVKYELDASNLVLETSFNSIYVSESDTDNAIKIPQYGTVKYVYQISDNDTISFIDKNGDNTEIKDINNTGYYTATIVDEKNQDIPNGSICTSDGSYTYTVKLESANEWFVCNSNTSKGFSVEVCPWEIILTMNDGSTVDTNNISLGTYTLSISNDAYTGTNTTLPNPTFSCLVNNENIISNNELTIDEDFITGTITASIKINEEEVEVASLEISRIDTSTYEAFILRQRDTNGTEVTDVTGANIETSSTASTKVTVENLNNSDSVWTYFVNPEDSRFTESGNYKVSVDIKSASKSVVGISAARADYFFTVNDTWTTCEFETGYVKGSTEHDFTIGLGLSSETQIRNLKIEKLETTDTSEPSLVFDISKDAITTYLNSANNSEKIVDVTKDASNGSYDITINTPMCHSTDNSVIQDVKLHLRSYALDSLGANNVYFEIANNGSTDFETSVMVDTASDKSISWNNNASPISASNFQTFSVDFPNYVENDELTVDLITSSTSISDSTSFTLSDFAVGTVDATRSPFSDKIFVYKTNANDDKGDVFAKLEDSSTISINSDSQINFDVLMFNNDAWPDESNSLSNTAWNEATRFIFADTTSTIGNLTYNVSQDNDGNPIYTLQNNTDTPVTVKISLNEKYEVVIEEVPQVTLAEGLTCDVQDDTVSLYISSAEGLATFRDIVNGTLTEDISVRYDSNENSNHTFTANTSYPSVNGTLRDSITLSGEWTPIGVYSNETDNVIPYSGLFDGNSNTIYFEDIIYTSSNLYSSGLFQMLAGTVQNVVTDGKISRTEAGDIGSITGYLDGGTIQYCINKATISNVSMTGTGGIIGCVGTAGGKITGCINLGNISSTSYAVGGIVGTTGNYLDSLDVEQCINLGELVGESYISGILGNSDAANIVINNCINLGTINAKSTSFAYASGIAIPSASTGYSFSNSINVGQVSATGETSSASGAISSIPTNGTYTNNYYDSTVNPSVVDSSTTGITGKSTTELIGSNISLEGISDGQWSFAEGRYPLPNIAESVPDGENGEIWNAVIVAATPEVSSSGGGSSVTIYTDYAELKNAIATISTGETETFYVSGDITSTSTTITVKGNITLLATEEGASIYRLSTFTSDSLFTIEKSASLVLGGTSSGQLVIDGSDVEVSYPLINSSGSLEIGEHCILQNNNNVTSTKKGGAIYEYCTSGDAPTLKISGGKIQNCNATAGGAIYIEGGTSCEINFDFSGGEISNNYATGNGGAVYLKNTSGTLSGTIIKNNYAKLTSPGSSAGGGGIYVTKSTLNMTAGSIENNTTNSYGGGVFVNTSGIFNITGGDIKENATNSETTDSMNIYAYGTVTINETTVPTACNQNIINGVLTDEISSYEFTDFVE